MSILKRKISRLFPIFPKFFWAFFAVCIFFTEPADAKGLIDSFNLAQFVPLVLDSMMKIATALYDYFVGNGTGLIYIFIYLFLAYYIGLYLVKMFFPKDWLSFFGFSGGGEMWDGKAKGWSIAENIAKPCIRVIVACVVLLQIKPAYVTDWLVNPFLEFGSIYTESIFKTLNNTSFDNVSASDNDDSLVTCPESIEQNGWISKRSCDFLVKPVYIISKENNRVIKYGLDFLKRGLRGLMTLIPHGGENILNIITGFLLVSTFISANLFMALLIIQAIFDFCLSLIMYPFNVLAWVAKKSDKWVDVLPAFEQIIDALKKMVICMIACAFILCINLAIVRALFNWSSSIFVVAAGGVSSTNVPTNTAMGFGQHTTLWLSSLLTFFLMQNIFNLTRERLDMYTNGTKHKMYDEVMGDAKVVWGKVKSTPDTLKNIWQTGKKLKGK